MVHCLFYWQRKSGGEQEKTDVFDLRETKNHDKRYFIFSQQNANTLEPIREMSPKKMKKKGKLVGRVTPRKYMRKTSRTERLETLVLIAW